LFVGLLIPLLEQRSDCSQKVCVWCWWSAFIYLYIKKQEALQWISSPVGNHKLPKFLQRTYGAYFLLSITAIRQELRRETGAKSPDLATRPRCGHSFFYLRAGSILVVAICDSYPLFGLWVGFRRKSLRDVTAAQEEQTPLRSTLLWGSAPPHK
jgi:hypothetical protein